MEIIFGIMLALVVAAGLDELIWGKVTWNTRS